VVYRGGGEEVYRGGGEETYLGRWSGAAVVYRGGWLRVRLPAETAAEILNGAAPLLHTDGAAPLDPHGRTARRFPRQQRRRRSIEGGDGGVELKGKGKEEGRLYSQHPLVAVGATNRD
jgi:hypothetical protein